MADGYSANQPCCVVMTKIGEGYTVLLDRAEVVKAIQSAMMQSQWLDLPCWNGNTDEDIGFCLVVTLDPQAVMAVTDRYIGEDHRASYHEAMMDYAKRKTEGTAT